MDKEEKEYDSFVKQVLIQASTKKLTSIPSNLKNEGPVKNVDLQVPQNAKEHHTDMYHLVQKCQTPIFRRGQPFTLTINFKQPFKIAVSDISLDFYTGFNSSSEANTMVRLKITESPDFLGGKDWAMRLKSKTDTSLILEVRSSAAAPVGIWRYKVVIQPGKQSLHGPQWIFLIFNPWCKDDAVYMENNEWRKEYVLNERGLIYKTAPSKGSPQTSTPWGYNQFSASVLPAALKMIEDGALVFSRRANPVDITRMLTNRSGSVLVGKWDLPYDGGKPPSYWKTGNQILDQYMETNSAVKFGQCWVFGGMLNSLCRALGIPCRPVTCFLAGHDLGENLTIDFYLQDNGTMKSDDSFWNYHVWNDAWMARPDMPKGYGGWQAIDATPQNKTKTKPETGKEEVVIDQCGPASLEAIKNGEILYVYDTQFIYTEVNGDFIIWKKDATGQYKISSYYKDYIGTCILTKAVGEDKTHDVTNQYKYKEGSNEERQSLSHAAKLIGKEDRLKEKVLKLEEEDIFFNLLPLKNVAIGKTITVVVQVDNRTLDKPATHTIDVNVGAQSVSYTGVKVNDLDLSGKAKHEDKLYKQKIQLASGQKEVITVEIPPSIYLDNLSEQGHIRIVGTGFVKAVNQVWYQEATIMIVKPEITVQVPAKLQVGKESSVSLQFTNPLPKGLTDCVFTITSNCVEKEIQLKFRNVKPNEAVTHQVKFTAEYPGPCHVIALFNSKELAYLSGSGSGNAA